jgi:hypothetical protein
MMRNSYFDYAKMMNEIDSYINKYPFVSVTGICESILGRHIPSVILGSGETVVAYVGGEDGRDSVSPFLLLRFIRDICSLYEEKGSAFGFSAENILKNYTLVIIPMLNADGSCYCSQGVDSENPIRERLIKMNGGNEDFSHWRGNARGVELKYNYGAEFDCIEPEPEVGALCNFLRYGFKPDILLNFSISDSDKSKTKCEEERIFYGDGEIEYKMAVALSQMGGIKRLYRQSNAPRLMLADWSINELYTSAFSVELPFFKIESQKQFNDKTFL